MSNETITSVSPEATQDTGKPVSSISTDNDIRAILKEIREQGTEVVPHTTVPPEPKLETEVKPEAKKANTPVVTAEADIAKTLEIWKKDFESNVKNTLLPKFKTAEEKMAALEQEVVNLKVGSAVADKLSVLRQTMNTVVEKHQLNSADYFQFTEYLRQRGVSDPQAIEDIADGLGARGFWKKPEVKQTPKVTSATEPTVPQSTYQEKAEFNYRDAKQREGLIREVLRQNK